MANVRISNPEEFLGGVVDTDALKDSAVTSAKIASNAVEQRHLADASVPTAALQDAAVTSAKVASGAVTPAKISVDLLYLASVSGSITPTTTGPKGQVAVKDGYVYIWTDDNVVVRFAVDSSW